MTRLIGSNSSNSSIRRRAFAGAGTGWLARGRGRAIQNELRLETALVPILRGTREERVEEIQPVEAAPGRGRRRRGDGGELEPLCVRDHHRAGYVQDGRHLRRGADTTDTGRQTVT